MLSDYFLVAVDEELLNSIKFNNKKPTTHKNKELVTKNMLLSHNNQDYQS